MKDSSKREQNESYRFTERENLRTKCKEIKYQQKYVRKLVDETIDLLRLSGHRKTLIFEAPTGSGKTVMASQLLADLTEELQSRGDSPYQQVAYIWIAPNKLHQQSYFEVVQAEAYRKEVGITNSHQPAIKPLLLIQLPNETDESMTSEDAAIAEQVKTYLRAIKDITTEKKELAVWLSNEKENLEGLEEPQCAGGLECEEKKGCLFLHPIYLSSLAPGFPPTGEVSVHQCIEAGAVAGFQQMTQLMNHYMLHTPFRQQQQID